MRLSSVFTFLFIFYFMYGFYISQSNFSVINKALRSSGNQKYYDYRGVSNVRTNLSSGSSSPSAVILDAKKSGLDFLILTDQNIPSSVDEYNGNLFILRGTEYSLLDMRILHLQKENSKTYEDLSEARTHLTDLLSQSINEAGSELLILAHPYNNGPTWTGELPTGLDGIEILNQKSISQKSWLASKLGVFWSLVCYPFNANLAFIRLFQEPMEELALWDKALQGKKLFGYAGADASARAIPFASYLIKFPSYEKSFDISSNHILLEDELTGNVASDKQKIFLALKNGAFYFALDLLGDPKGFYSYMQNREKTLPIGSTIKFNRHLRLIAKLPATPNEFYEVVVYKNGERDLTANQPEINYEIPGPGVYRIVVRVSVSLPFPDGKKWMTWIYTNPFFVK